MKKAVTRQLFILALLFCTLISQSQNETNKWYFGTNAGLDFMTNPPTVLTNGALTTIEGCATISDASGSLLFYTDGITVYDKTHAVMANGSGLNGNSSSSQSAIIAKQPGNSNIYYIFTQSGPIGAGAGYSVVDMSLAAGMGSVTVKNTTLAANCTEKLTSVKHCNGNDVWVIYHDWNSADFRAYLLTSTGVNAAAPVMSTIGSMHTNGTSFAGCMKTSPNGKKLGVAIYGTGMFEMFDFDNTTGVVSNSLSLNTSAITSAYGCEFSPDGTKFYGSRGVNGAGTLFQWDLCAGSGTAIAASLYTVVTTNTTGIGALQRASDGKIYGTRSQQSTLMSVNNPNVAGSGCNYIEMGLSIAPKTSYWSLPNFITSFKPEVGPFTQTLACNSASFSLPAIYSGTIGASCQGASYSLTNVAWNFGDPSSGAANTSVSNNPVHQFSGAGTYTTQLILYFSCGGGTDTLDQTVTVNGAAPSLSVSGTFTICSGEKRVYTASGANTYSWSIGSTSPSITTNLTNSFAYTVTGTSTTGCTSQHSFTVTVNKCAGILEQQGNEAKIADIYPNPVSDQLNIDNTEKILLVLLDLQGREVMRREFGAGHQQLDLHKLEDGIYYLKIFTNKSHQTQRLVKMQN